jgi:hypothetical protein
VEGALAGFAEFFFARGGAVGFWFEVGHWSEILMGFGRGYFCLNADRAFARLPTHATA